MLSVQRRSLGAATVPNRAGSPRILRHHRAAQAPVIGVSRSVKKKGVQVVRAVYAFGKAAQRIAWHCALVQPGVLQRVMTDQTCCLAAQHALRLQLAAANVAMIETPSCVHLSQLWSLFLLGLLDCSQRKSSGSAR